VYRNVCPADVIEPTTDMYKGNDINNVIIGASCLGGLIVMLTAVCAYRRQKRKR